MKDMTTSTIADNKSCQRQMAHQNSNSPNTLKNVFFGRKFFLAAFLLVGLAAPSSVLAENPPQLLFMPKDQSTILQRNIESIRLEWVYGLPPFTLEIFQSSGDQSIIEKSAITQHTTIKCSVQSNQSLTSVEYRLYGVDVTNTGWAFSNYSLYLSDALGNVAFRKLIAIDSVPVKNSNDLSPTVLIRSLLDRNSIRGLFDARQQVGDLSAAKTPTRLLLRNAFCRSIRGSLH